MVKVKIIVIERYEVEYLMEAESIGEVNDRINEGDFGEQKGIFYLDTVEGSVKREYIK